MILCVTPNPAIDKTVRVAGFRLGQIHRPDFVISLPGGKGINVARALKTLAEEPLVTGWIGGTAGTFLEQGLQEEGIRSAFLRTDGETRTCLSIADSNDGVVTEIYENGAPLSPTAVAAFENHFQTLLGSCRAAAFSGSLPPGLSPSTYAGLIRTAREAGLFCALDSGSDTLRAGLEQGRPHLIKPNRSEFCQLTGANEASELSVLAQAARKLAHAYRVIVLLSLGERGALAAGEEEVWHAASAPVAVASAVGSGDALLAGALSARLHGSPLEEMLRCGVASGTANTLSLGAGRFAMEDYDRIRNNVVVSRL